RHRNGIEIDVGESDFEIAQRVHRHADATHFAHGFRRIGIKPALGGEIESNVKPGLPVGDEMLEPLVGIGGIGKAGVLPHGPRTVAVHEGMDAAGERLLPRPAPFEAAARNNVLLVVERLDLDTALVDDPSQLLAGASRPGFLLFSWGGTHFTFSLMKATISSVRLPVGKTPR